MNDKTIEELAQEHPEIEDVLSRLRLIEKKADPSLMDNIRDEEQDALNVIADCIRACEAKTGRSLYTWAQHLLYCEFKPNESYNFQVDQIIEVRPTEADKVEMPDLKGSLKLTLQALGTCAGQNKTQWSTSSAFVHWAQSVLNNAFNEARNTSAFK